MRELQLLVTSLSQDNLTLSDDFKLQEIGDRLLGLLEAFPRHSDTSHQMKGHLSSIHAAAVTLWNVAVAFRASGNVSLTLHTFRFYDTIYRLRNHSLLSYVTSHWVSSSCQSPSPLLSLISRSCSLCPSRQPGPGWTRTTL